MKLIRVYMRSLILLVFFTLNALVCQWSIASPVDSLLSLIESSQDTSIYSHYDNLIEALLEDPDSALYYTEEALELSLKNNDRLYEGKLRIKKGFVLERMGLYEQGVKEFHTAHNIFTELNNEYFALWANLSMSALLIDIGKYEEASQHLFYTLEIIERKHFKDLQSKCYNNIGLLFFRQNEFQQSISYYQKSIPIKKKLNKLGALALTYNNIGISYYYLGLLDSVLINFERSLHIYEDIDDKFGQARPLSNIGEIYYLKGHYEKALEYYHRALDIEMELGYRSGYSLTLMEIGKVYAQQNDFEKALKNQRKGFKVIEDLDSPALIMEGYEYLYETFDLMNLSDSALKYYKNFVSLKDSLYNLKKSQQISELEKIYETEKKDYEILKLERERDQKRIQTAFLVSLIILSTLISVIITIYLKAKNKTLILKAITAEQKKQFSAVLKAQEDERKRIAGDLHDSVGPLLSVSQLYISDVSGFKGLDKDTSETIDKATKVLNEATNEVRDISHNLMPGVLVRSGLAPACRELIRRVKETKCAKISIKTDDEEVRYNEAIEIGFYRILQELINNILKHAQATKIHVEIKQKNGELTLRVIDDGVGFNTYELENAKGIGLQNINSRLSLINGQIHIRSSKNTGAEIQVTAPIK